MRTSSNIRCVHSNGISDTTTVSLVVDSVQRSGENYRNPGRAWPGDDIRHINNYNINQMHLSTESTNLFV
jgi:hypothetical protein